MDQLIGKYRILERIGRGGMGSVYKAHDPVLDRASRPDLPRGPACAKLRHPNIVTIYDLGEADGNLLIVMELLEGEELRHLSRQEGAVE